MQIDVTPVFKNSDNVVEFDYMADLSAISLTYGERPAEQPLRVAGRVFAEYGAVSLSLTVCGTLYFVCDRCTERYTHPIEAVFSVMLSQDTDVEESEAVLVVPEGWLDVDRTAHLALIDALPDKYLCCADCKGLCPVCGIDRNVATCVCEKQ